MVTAHSQNREPRGTAVFARDQIASALGRYGLPAGSPLSVLCVEVLPGPMSRWPTHTSQQEDPLGSQLGQRRILRTSPLTTVPAIC